MYYNYCSNQKIKLILRQVQNIRQRSNILIIFNLTLMSTPVYKVIVLGMERIGKTSIAIKYVKNEFDENQKSTINASYLEKKVTLDNDQTVKLTIWDTAGQEEFNSVAPIYYREAMGAVVAYQITSVQSFQKVKKWITELEDNAPKGIVLTIVGNKADLQTSRKVSKDEAEKYAKSVGANHFLVSAKNGLNVKEMFKDLAERVHVKQSSNKNTSSKRGGPKLTVQREQLDKKPQKKKDCC